ncbi:hypothetical protein CDAR_110881 [Caerostris darwini]|uniref:Uncharacterized protein n=1 Tax=Caerostris darwini TaxID=1538125 RepID=A0AAV4QST2_9ARAC|nr:hypothetical protein CDAR_110881 [Caerostris darwini]
MYTGVPASHLPSKKKLIDLKKAKELQNHIAAEAAKNVENAPTTLSVLTEQSVPVAANKRKTPTSDATAFVHKTPIEISHENWCILIKKVPSGLRDS